MNFTRILLASALTIGLAACNNSQQSAQEAADTASKSAQEAADATKKAAQDAATAAQKAADEAAVAARKAADATSSAVDATRYDLILQISPKYDCHAPYPNPD